MLGVAILSFAGLTFTCHPSKLKELGSQCNSIFVTMQIVLLLESNHAEVGGTEMPDPYSGFLKTVGKRTRTLTPTQTRQLNLF